MPCATPSRKVAIYAQGPLCRTYRRPHCIRAAARSMAVRRCPCHATITFSAMSLLPLSVIVQQNHVVSAYIDGNTNPFNTLRDTSPVDTQCRKKSLQTAGFRQLEHYAVYCKYTSWRSRLVP